MKKAKLFFLSILTILIILSATGCSSSSEQALESGGSCSAAPSSDVLLLTMQNIDWTGYYFDLTGATLENSALRIAAGGKVTLEQKTGGRAEIVITDLSFTNPIIQYDPNASYPYQNSTAVLRVPYSNLKAGTYTITYDYTAQYFQDKNSSSVTHEFTHYATDAFKLTVAPVIDTESLPNCTVNKTYSQNLSSNISECTWTLESGTLPEGLSLSSEGIISGTPVKSGNYAFTIKGSYSGENTTDPIYPIEATHQYTLSVTNANIAGSNAGSGHSDDETSPTGRSDDPDTSDPFPLFLWVGMLVVVLPVIAVMIRSGRWHRMRNH